MYDNINIIILFLIHGFNILSFFFEGTNHSLFAIYLSPAGFSSTGNYVLYIYMYFQIDNHIFRFVYLKFLFQVY